MDEPNAATVNILGIRGIPAAHGGFETFAAALAEHLRDRGWRVNVYCQIEPGPDGTVAADYNDVWNGIHRTHLGAKRAGSSGSVAFDWKCAVDSTHRDGVDLVLGYNTAIFSALSRLRGRRIVMNMDGLEWKRDKWSLPIKAWFYLNEFVGANTCTVPVADHPEIARSLGRHFCRRAIVIPYGSPLIEKVSPEPIERMGLRPDGYLISIARIEPENSILEIVRTFAERTRGRNLVVLGKLQPDNPYHRAVADAASAEVLFPGAIYSREVVSALRCHARAYVHGHQVGGTNPSLVEALGAGNAVIAHRNRFNMWVAGPGQLYFKDATSLNAAYEALDSDEVALRAREAARRRHAEAFTLERVNSAYERLLTAVLRSETIDLERFRRETGYASLGS